jgi:osmotically-inducible protein OsmY
LGQSASPTREEDAMGFEDHVQRIDPANSAGLASTSRIEEGAESCLHSNSYLALKNVSCQYREGVLTLRGSLPSYYLKQVAQTAVARLDGVQRIVNEIEVVAERY